MFVAFYADGSVDTRNHARYAEINPIAAHYFSHQSD
jgi:hypothetical protein